MADADVIMPVERGVELPVVRHIDFDDIVGALRDGLADFRAMPSHAVFLCLIYPVLGALVSSLVFGLDLIQLLYPVAAGFALLGPFAAIGLYELSRRREQGLDTSVIHALDVLHSPSLGAILTVGLLLVAIFLGWIGTAHLLYASTFGDEQPMSVGALAHSVLTTSQGWRLAILGNLIGLCFAAVAFLIGALSFPLLLDRHVSPAVAMATSVRAVLINPGPMLAWGLTVAVILAIGSLPLLLGLAVAVPILGHATWHLYRRVVVPDMHPRPLYAPVEKSPRYGADFPANLFTRSPPPRPDGTER